MIMFNLQFGPVSSALERWFDHSTRSVWLAVGSRLESVVGKWALVVLAAASFNVLRAPTRPSTTIEVIGMAFPFLAIGADPVVAYRLAMRWPATPTSPVVSHP